MFFVYLGLWIILNGRFTWEIFYFGLVIAAAIDLFSIKYLDYSPKKTLKVLTKVPGILSYLIHLVIEIVKANFGVLKLIYSVSEEPEPRFVHFKSGLKTATANVMLANSITLTPGTYTLFQEGDHFVVHCLKREYGEGLEGSSFVKYLRLLDGGEEK